MATAMQRMITMTPEDKNFYTDLGQRISLARKSQNLTQQQLAEALGIAQQTMAHYEGGTLRISIATLLATAEALSMDADDLLYESSNTKTKSKRGPTSVLHQQIEQIGLMPRAKQKFIIEMLDAMIKQQQAS
jgi:transcriptional regulator with XRE-family HTH domain